MNAEEDDIQIIRSVILDNFINNRTSLEPVSYTDDSIIYKLFKRKDVICVLQLHEDRKIFITSETVVDSVVIHNHITILDIMEFDGNITDELLGL